MLADMYSRSRHLARNALPLAGECSCADAHNSLISVSKSTDHKKAQLHFLCSALSALESLTAGMIEPGQRVDWSSWPDPLSGDLEFHSFFLELESSVLNGRSRPRPLGCLKQIYFQRNRNSTCDSYAVQKSVFNRLDFKTVHMETRG